MTSNPPVTRFQIGQSYRLATSKGFPRLLGGTLRILSEIKPADTWGSRILLADIALDTAHAPEIRNRDYHAARLYVEEGYATLTDSHGEHAIPAEVATVQGVYPYFAKAYAVDGIPAAIHYPSAEVA